MFTLVNLNIIYNIYILFLESCVWCVCGVGVRCAHVLHIYVCVRVCACSSLCVCVHACVCVCARMCVLYPIDAIMA
jgi:hypothetical protein